MSWFHDLPSAALAFLVVAFTIAISLLGLVTAVGWVRRTRVHENLDNGAISGLLSALVGIYAIAAGLTAVAVWGNTVDAATNVGREVAAISVLFHNLDGYPEPLRGQGKQAIADYARHVIDQEWQLHRRGEVPKGAVPILARAQQAFFAYEPVTQGQQIIHAAVLESFNRLIEFRRLRLQSVEDTALPGALWAVVILLGVLAIASCFLLRLDSLRMHFLVTSLIAAPIALILYFIAVTDRPFQGGVTVSAKPYETVLEEIIIPELRPRN